MNKLNLAYELKSNIYLGRGIIIGKSNDGKYAVIVYFITGRSENSRNRVFVEDGDIIRTQLFNSKKSSDSHLIIYNAVRIINNNLIVTNGNQTDTICDYMEKQFTFEQSLRIHEFEDDAPNYTPRISGILHFENQSFNYEISIIKSANGNPNSCQRYIFSYSNPIAGDGHFIHTYMGDEYILRSFEGEPKLVGIPDNIIQFKDLIWTSLNDDNKISLFVRYVNLENGLVETKVVNKNK